MVVRYLSICLLMAFTSLSLAAPAPVIQSNLNAFYGSDPTKVDRELRTMDVYWQDIKQKRPGFIYLHGGGWAFGDKSEINNNADYFVPQGFAFISINHRLRWDYNLFDQLEDVVDAISWVRKYAGAYGIDTSRIILMGNGAGSHLASLVATDARHLKRQGLSLSDLKVVVAIDSANYDIPLVHKELGTFIERPQHQLIFGKDPNVQLEASPIYHVKAGKGIAGFALLYAPNTGASRIQAQAFAKRLIDSKVNTVMIPGNAKTKQSIDVELSSAGDSSTSALMALLRAST
ncbi:MAG: acetyl esterase/lipase [Patiriisocius sp.]|jgi:acetyl esterase/lipase